MEGALPLRTAPEINPDVVDRPGVPADLRDLYWWTFNDAGSVGTTAQVGLPAGEVILDVAHGLVVSMRGPREAATGTVLVVRDFATGAVVREVETDVWSTSARVVGRAVVWTGMALGDPCDDDSPNRDGGVWVLDLDSSDAPREIVVAGTAVRHCFTGRSLVRSPSGEAIGAVMSGYGGDSWVDVIDTATMSRERRVTDLWPWAITDNTGLQWDNPPSDFMAVGWGVTAYNLSTGVVRWQFPDEQDAKRFAPFPVFALGSRFVVQYVWGMGDGSDRVIASFNARTGARRELLRQTIAGQPGELSLQPGLSAGSVLSLSADTAGDGVVNTPISIIDLETGDLTRDAFVIDPPFLCYDEYCLRD